MSTVTIQLSPDTEQKLRYQANQAGQTLKVYLELLAERASRGGELEAQPRYVSDPKSTQAEFERLLKDLASGPSLTVLPADFSRADIYNGHD